MLGYNRGYTLIELLISMGIMFVVIILAMALFNANVSNFEIISNESELQFQSQYILNFISTRIMESVKIELIRIEGAASVINSKREFSISKMALLYNDQLNLCYIFVVKNNRIYYGNGNSHDAATVELGRYITEMKAAPYPQGKTFAEARALRITIRLRKGNQSYEADQIIYMRNS
ncbi:MULTISPECIES: PilW family protein [unclassified Sedimentibacter]|uniref:PilW family protein n=1 Tax=unclassified Sedimentibacter TaxID=2649220 RepID=UPI0027E18121|nr:prepilin-type N-terminal cleavage/methylation domain-containing protein [Sedimentibacter sp. MB35-C1]WMJ76662.1 prepilin-type N-terminal cleavage/methylation domain-containing protein [Sedimentibacter sp. MB35-C1]